MSDTYDTIAAGVKRLRNRNNTGIREFSRKVQISVGHLYKIENCEANPTVDILERIAHAHDFTLIEFLSFCEDIYERGL